MTYLFGFSGTSSKYDKKYDALVDAGGGGDYLDIPDAIAAGKKKLLIAPGTYSWNTVVLNDGDFLMLEGLSEKPDDVIIQPVLDSTSYVFDISGINNITGVEFIGGDYSYSVASKTVSLIQNFANYQDFTTLFNANDIIGFGRPAHDTACVSPYATITALDSTSLTFDANLYFFDENDNSNYISIFKETLTPPSLICKNLTFDCTCDTPNLWATFVYDDPNDDWSVWIQKFTNVNIKYVNFVSSAKFNYVNNWGRVHRDSFFYNVFIEGGKIENSMRIPGGFHIIHKNYGRTAELDFSDGGFYGIGVITDSWLYGGDTPDNKYKQYSAPVFSMLGSFTMDSGSFPNKINGMVGKPDGTISLSNTSSEGTVIKTDFIATTYGAQTRTLYLSNVPPYTLYTIKDISGNASVNNITINTGDGALIDGQTSIVLNTDYSSVTLVNDGSNWFII